MAQVSNLVDQVLAGLAEGIRDKCDRAQILAALDELGCATTMDSLREHLLAAPDGLNKALGDVAPAFFVARFQKAATESSDELQARAGADPLLAEPVSTSEVAVSTGGTSGSASRTRQARRMRIRPGMQVAGVRDVVNKFTATVALTLELGAPSSATVTQSTQNGVPEAIGCPNPHPHPHPRPTPHPHPHPHPHPRPNPSPSPNPNPNSNPNPNPNPNPNQVCRRR
jgi:hypothetical protein